VTFTYYILDFEGGQRVSKPSNHAVQSSATCTMFRLSGDKYWKDNDNDDQTPKGMLYESYGKTLMKGAMTLMLILETDWKDGGNGETIAKVLRVLDSRGAWPQEAEQVTWAAPLPVVGKLALFSVTCKQSATSILEALSTNRLSSRCVISRNSLGMRLKPFRNSGRLQSGGII